MTRRGNRRAMVERDQRARTRPAEHDTAIAAHPAGRPSEGPVEIEEPGIGVSRVDRRVASEEVHRRFGGVDLPATLVGMLTALALLILLAGLVGAAVGAIGYQAGLSGNQAKLSIGGLIGGVVALFVAYWVGGWAAARIARYDGVRNGLMTGVWTIVVGIVLAVLGAALGAEYNVFGNVQLPNWFSRDALTLGAVVSGIIAAAAMFAGAALGGRTGERYHRRADETIAGTRAGGVTARRKRDDEARRT